LIFDVYRGKGIPEGYKSIAIRVRYRSYERTLTDDDISSLHKKVTDGLVSKLKVTLR
jgi:phenylalanyl-tRNA synthetase beta chain